MLLDTDPDVFALAQRKAKSTCEDAVSGYKATLQDEASNVKRLQVLKEERDSLHTMVNEQVLCACMSEVELSCTATERVNGGHVQIKWCKDFVEVSKQESQKKKGEVSEACCPRVRHRWTII